MESNTKTTVSISKKSFLTNYSLIPGPGKYLVQAGKANLVFDETLGKEKYIVNLKAIRGTDAGKVQSIFSGVDTIDITMLNGLTLAHNIIVNTGDESIPANGEMVEVQFSFVVTKSGEEKLVPTFMKVKQAVKAISFFSLLEESVPTTDITKVIS